MRQFCGSSGQAFDISEADLAFYDKVSPTLHGRRHPIPPPRLSPLARAQRRLAAINQLYVYSRHSSVTGKPIFSLYPDEVPFPVYENDYWWSDAWDALTYGQDFDFSRPFFAQFDALARKVPHFARMVLNVENCDYCNNVSACKNCYLVFNSRYAEGCFNCESALSCIDCLDCSFSSSSELCFDCVTCDRCYNVQGSLDSEDCRDSYFLFNCRSCRNCFGCANLRRAEYVIFNERVTRSAYEDFISRQRLSSYRERNVLKEKSMLLWRASPRPHIVSRMAENVSGNYIFESRAVHNSMLVRKAENIRYCFNLFDNVRDSYDYSAYGHNAELIYESARCGNDISELCFCSYCYNNCSNLLYCTFCVSCKDCLGCVGLNKKQHCIFNRQYSPKEYESLASRIVEHMQGTAEWGEFFPLELSPFPYNHSFAQRYFPKSRAEIEQSGLWYYDKTLPGDNKAVDADNLPDDLPQADIPLVARSAISKLPYRISQEEIRRLRGFSAPLPRLTYDERMNQRASAMGGMTLFERRCEKTGQKLACTIEPDETWCVWNRDEYEREFSN